ncbi:MAG: hypothetical protein JWO38_1167 [Gemmataceae bacterium]|nr:hypothetical protein [Gemmataceae bacterium]
MSIVAECPHCETRFNLRPDLVGKAMRCPNLDCRQAFVVKPVAPPQPAPAPATETLPTPPAANAPATPRVDAPRPVYTSGSVGDFLPLVEAEAVSNGSAAPKALPPPADEPEVFDALPDEPQVVDAVPVAPVAPPEPEVVEAVVISAPPPARELVWKPGAELPPPKPAGRERKPVRAESATEDLPVLRRRKKRKHRGPVILIGLTVVLLLVAGATVLFLLRVQVRTEAQFAQDAMEQYKRNEYGPSGKAFDKLAADYPDSADAEKYRFFADLSAVQVVVRSVTNRENPRPAIDKLRAFIDTHKESPFVKTDAYGHDVLDAGKKVIDDVADYAADRVKAYQGDRTKADELRLAEETLAAGRDFVPLLGPFRTKEDKPLDELGKRFETVKVDIDRERDRLATLAQVGVILKSPTDPAIEEAKTFLAAKGWADDPEARELIRRAEGDFLRRVRYDRDPAAPQPLPPPGAASFLFVTPVGPTRPAVREALGGEPSAVFLAVARGVLYALDEDTGDQLWAARVGPDVFDLPAVARAELAEGPTDLAVVTSNVAGKPAVSGYTLRAGRPVWSQPLPFPAAGPVAVSGARVFVPTRDPAGTVFVFDLTSGIRVGRITIGQPVGSVVARAGTTQLYIAAESRRVFVFDVDAGDEGGAPRCARVIPTEHPAGTLRTPPVILGPPGDAPAPRWLVLAQADGPTAMKLRAFPLPPAVPPGAADAPPVIEPIVPAADLPLPGWSWFPPVSDGERFATVTDAGQFRLFGINQPGNKDSAVFPLPYPDLPAPPDGRPVRGLVVPAEEGAFWVLAGGALQKFRLTLLPERGLALVPVAAGLAVGEPTQPAQLTPRRDAACFVVRSTNSAGYRAVAVRLEDGEPRWQRQLGVIPIKTAIRTEAGVMLVDEDGGAVAIPAAGVAIPRVTTKAAPDWVVAAPPDGVSGPTRVVTSADGKTVFAITPIGPAAAAKWLIRRMAGGKVDHTGTVNAPAPLAGPPVVMNGSLLLPAADGFVHRLVLGDGRLKPDALAPGPKWLADRRTQDPECFVTPLADDTFLTSDGGRGLKRWGWPADGAWVDGDARWEVRERIAGPPLVLPAAGGRPAQFLVADVTGSVWLYGQERAETAVRRWVPGRTVSLPGGKASSGFAVQTDPAGRQLVVYVVDGKQVVCLDVDSNELRWVTPAGDDVGRSIVGLPHPMGDGRWLVTDLSGRVSVLDAETGRPTLTREVGLPGAVPAAAGVPVGDSRVVIPLSDGSTAVVEFPAVAPGPKAKG